MIKKINSEKNFASYLLRLMLLRRIQSINETQIRMHSIQVVVCIALFRIKKVIKRPLDVIWRCGESPQSILLAFGMLQWRRLGSPGPWLFPITLGMYYTKQSNTGPLSSSEHESDNNREKCRMSHDDIVYTPYCCLLYTSPSPRDGLLSRMPSSA